MKPHLPFVETMITQVCNLSCRGCTNYSDLKHTGYVTWAQGQQDLQQWLRVLDIGEFGIMGGEPMINPEWKQWLTGVRTLMPQTTIRFTTNGLLLHKYPDMIDFLEALGNITFKITVHLVDPDLQIQLDHITHSQNWKAVHEYGIDRWLGSNGLRLQINRPATFTKTYKNSYADMAPWQSDPVQAFANCCQQTCPLLYNQRIYKCSTSGLLHDTLARFSFPNYQQWEPYIDSGIGVDSGHEHIQSFVNNFNLPHRICAQCPTSDQVGSKLSHLITVHKK